MLALRICIAGIGLGTGAGITWPQIVCIYYCFLYFALSFATEVVAGFWLLS